MKNIISDTTFIADKPIQIKLENDTVSLIACNNNTEAFTITRDNDEILKLDCIEIDQIAHMSKLNYWLSDIMRDIDTRITAGIYTAQLYDDIDLISDMLVEYAKLRNENDGGDSDNMMIWKDCIDDIFGTFCDRLAKYEI